MTEVRQERVGSVRRMLAVSRPRFWPYLVGPVAVGLVAAGWRGDWTMVALLAYCSLPANLLIYGVNDLFDRETDRLNDKKGSYEALLDPREDRRLKRLILLTNLPFLALVPFLPWPALVWLGVFLVLGVGYSAPPLRFKTRPGLDAASNFLYAAPGFAAYTAVAGRWPEPLLVVAALLWCAAMHAYSAVPDIVADRRAGMPTIATVLGARPTLALCLGLWLASAALLAPWLPLVAAVGGAAYLVLGLASLGALRREGALLRLYKVFPFVNTALGGVLFFAVFFGL